MYLYSAYGLGIQSNVALPELVSVERANDVTIQVRTFLVSERQDAADTSFWGETANAGTFLVRGGREICIEPVPGVEESFLRSIILGPLFCVLLRQRGFAVLHASSVADHNGAVAFIGRSGEGKSTLVNAFYQAGYSLITDDILAINLDANPPHVLPSAPYVRLLPDAVDFFIPEEETIAQEEKYIYRTARGFLRTPHPLRRLYILDRGENQGITQILPREAFIELVRHSRAVSLLQDDKSVDSHFRHCAQLVTQVPIRRLTRRLSLSALSDVPHLVEADLFSD